MTLPALLARRVATDGATPFLTAYDDATGERVELSATTYANWVAKTANLLVDALGAGRGDEAVVRLPALHWQTYVVVGGCWAAGLTVRFDGEGDVGFAVEGAAPPACDEVVALSLRPMGAGLAVPDGAVTDFATEVRGHGDRFAGEGPEAADEALTGRSHADLLLVPPSGSRSMVSGDDPPLDEAGLVAAYVAPLVGGGSTVLCRHADAALLDRRAETERVG